MHSCCIKTPTCGATMKIEDAIELAQSLLQLHGLNLPIRFSRARRMLGAVAFKNKVPIQLILSSAFIEANDEHEVRDVILHEIAHALVGVDHQHNHVWKAKCREIGARPEQYASLDRSKMVPTHEVKCCGCGKVFKQLFAASRKDYSRYRCPCQRVGAIKCVPFWSSVEDELRKLIKRN